MTNLPLLLPVVYEDHKEKGSIEGDKTEADGASCRALRKVAIGDFLGLEELDPLDNLKGQKALDMLQGNRACTQVKHQWGHMGDEEKKTAVHEEMKRMHQLPANSTYATHRLRVLNKILQLMSIQRSASQEEELQLLFAGLSL